jgi:hypothetical protein
MDKKHENENETPKKSVGRDEPLATAPGQDPKLAEMGIYQPADQVANAPQIPQDEKETEEQEEHRKNLDKMPPVPAERAGAASQAK